MLRQVWRPALLAAGLVVAGLVLQRVPLGGSAGTLTQLAAMRGPGGALLFVAVATVLCAVGLPRQIAAYGAGYAYGVWPGIILVLAVQLIACAANFYWARLVARDWAQRLMRRRWHGRLAKLDAFLTENPFSATLTLRLLPVGNNLALNLLAGLSGIAAVPFLAGSAIGYLPQTVIFALIGGGVRVDRSLQLAVGVALFAISAAVGILLLRRFRAVVPV